MVFEKHLDTQYAFDPIAYNKELTNDYKKVNDAFVPFKAVPNGLTDKLWAKVTITGTDVIADSVFFKTQNGIKVDAVKEGDHFVLTLKGAQKFALEEVQATIKQGDKYKIAGVFTMVHISPKQLKLKLIPTKGVSISNDKKNEIITIYKQLAIDVNVSVVNEFDIDKYLVNNKIPTEDTFGDLSTYSSEQNAIIDAYKSANNVEQAYYIFVTDKASSTGQSGYMKLNGQFGFVFDQNATTIAHELAHGAFKLEHPFKKFKNKVLKQNATQALMDYAGGTEFLFTDWKQISDPAFKLYAFQSQSDGEFTETHLTPDLKIISITESSTLSFNNLEGIPDGTLPGYVIYTTKKDNNDKIIVTDKKYFQWNSSSKQYENYERFTYDFNLKVDVNNSNLDIPNKPIEITEISGKYVSLFYNYKNCPGGLLNVKATDLKTIISKNKLGKYLLDNSKLTGISLVCVNLSNNETIEDENYKKWKIENNNIGVPLDCYSSSAKIAVNENLVEINKITSNTSDKETNRILKENYQECVFANIDINQRITILNNLINKASDDSVWEFSEGILSLGDKFFLDDLILLTPEEERLKLLKDGFIQNNWIEPLFNKSVGFFNNDVTTNETIPLFRALGSWVAQYYNKLNIVTTMATEFEIGPQSFNTFEYPVASVNPVYLGTNEDGSEKFNFIIEIDGKLYNPKINDRNDYAKPSVKLENNRVEFKQYLFLIPHGDQIYQTGNSPTIPVKTSILNVNYYEPVIMVASRNYIDLKIEANQEYTVPAFVAAIYQQAIIDKTTEQSIRSLGNGIAITAAIVTIPTSGGGSLAAYIAYAGGVVAGVDEVIKTERLNLNKTPGYAEKYGSYYDTWETFYTTVGLLDAGVGVYTLANNIKKFNFIKSTKNFYSKMKEFDYDGQLMYIWQRLNNVSEAGNWLDDLDVLIGAGTKTKINNWIGKGLSESKLEAVFSKSTDKAGLLNKLENSKSIYHQRVHIEDWDNIPGVTKSNYVNNSLPKQEIPASNFDINDANYNLPSYRAATFTDNVELITLPENTKIYRVTDVGGEGGAFWTLTPPSSLDDVIGGTAVMPEWNGFSKVVEYTVPNGGIKVWKGKAASQPISENPLLLNSPNMLSGGEYQVFINDIVRNQSFKDAILDVTSLYKTW